MQTFAVPFVQTQADKRRSEAVKTAEASRSKTKTPDFVREGLGACRTVGDPDDFTNGDTRGIAGREARNRARAVCRTCPFAEECLTWAQATYRDGVFGGEWLISGRMTGKV
jgi:hypothetical protein